jgi:hypothetical protein
MRLSNLPPGVNEGMIDAQIGCDCSDDEMCEYHADAFYDDLIDE